MNYRQSLDLISFMLNFGVRYMRKRSYFYSAVAMSGLLMGAGVVSSSASAGQFSLAAQTNWAVSKVDGANENARYCAMARRYSHNVVLSLAQNMNSETSLALDFLSNSFDVNEHYRVVVSPGAGEHQEFEVKPVSGQAIVLRLGDNSAFMDALMVSERLDVSVAEHEYRFEMTDLREGQASLNGCVRGLSGEDVAKADDPKRIVERVAEAVTGPVAAVASAVPAMQCDATDHGREKKLAAKITKLENKLETLQRAEGGSSKRLVDVNMKLAQKDEKIQLLNAQMDQGRSERLGQEDKVVQLVTSERALKDQIVTLRREMDGYKSKLSQKVGDQDAQGRLAQLELDVSKKDEQVKLLRAQKNDALAKLATYGDAKDDATRSSADQALKLSKAEEARDLLRKEADRLRADVSRYEDELAQSRREIDSAQGDVRDLRSQLSAMPSATSVVSSVASVAAHAPTALISSGSAVSAGVDEARREVMRLGSMLDNQRSQCSADKKRMEQVLFDPELGDAQYQDMIGSLQNELDVLRDRFARQETDLRRESAGKIERHRSDIDRLNKTVKLLEGEKALVQAKSSGGDKSGMVARMERDLASYRSQKDVVEAQLAEAKRQNALTRDRLEEFETDAAALKDENVRLKSQILDTDYSQTDWAKERSDMSLKLAQLQESKARLMMQLSGDAQAQTQGPLLKNIAELEERLYAAEGKVVSLDQALSSARKGSERFQIEKEALEKQASSLGDDRATLKSQLTLAQADKEQFGRELGALKIEKAKIEQERSRLEGDLSRVSSELQQSKLEFANYKTAHDLKGDEALAAAQNGYDRRLSEYKSTQEALLANKIKEAQLDKQEALAMLRVELDTKFKNDMVQLEADARRSLDRFQQDVDKRHDNDMNEVRLMAKDELVGFRSRQDDLVSAEVNKQIKIWKQKQRLELEQYEQELKQAHMQDVERLRGENDANVVALKSQFEGDLVKAVEKARVVEQAEIHKKMMLSENADDMRYSQSVADIARQSAPAPVTRAVEPVVKPVVELVSARKSGHPADLMTPMVDGQNIVSAHVVDASFIQNDELEQLLKQAHVSLSQNVEKARLKGQDNGRVSHVWMSDDKVMGSLEQIVATAGQSFTQFVGTYLTNSQKRCTGEFAAIENDGYGGQKMQGYEIACVPDGSVTQASSAALLFADIGGIWTVFANETSAANMDVSMDVRDRIHDVVAKKYIGR